MQKGEPILRDAAISLLNTLMKQVISINCSDHFRDLKLRNAEETLRAHIVTSFQDLKKMSSIYRGYKTV